MTANKKYKKRVRARMKLTGEKYTVAKRAIDTERELDDLADTADRLSKEHKAREEAT